MGRTVLSNVMGRKEWRELDVRKAERWASTVISSCRRLCPIHRDAQRGASCPYRGERVIGAAEGPSARNRALARGPEPAVSIGRQCRTYLRLETGAAACRDGPSQRRGRPKPYPFTSSKLRPRPFPLDDHIASIQLSQRGTPLYDFRRAAVALGEMRPGASGRGGRPFCSSSHGFGAGREGVRRWQGTG